MNDKYKDYTRTALINELEVYKHAINEGAQRIEERDQRIAELEEETEAYQKEINDFCNKRYFGCLKDADKKLTELEEENAKLKKEYEFCHNDLRSKIDYIHDQDEVINYYKEENAKLQEQMINAIIKFEIGQTVYSIRNVNTIKPLVVHDYKYDVKKKMLEYWTEDDVFIGTNKDTFATEADAQKYLEERK